MACGEFGPGRMAEPLAIVAAVERELARPTLIPLPRRLRRTGPLAGRHVVVTAGPTYEPIDPVRFIGNRSSGRQGHAIARGRALRGRREVTLISGPVALADPPGRRRSSGSKRRARCAKRRSRRCPPTSSSPRPRSPTGASKTSATEKLKKGSAARADPVPGRKPRHSRRDREAAPRRRPALVIGFAAETEDVMENARAQACSAKVATSSSPTASPKEPDVSAAPTTRCRSSSPTGRSVGRA